MTIDHVTVTAQAREHAARNHFTLRAKAKNVSETQKIGRASCLRTVLPIANRKLLLRRKKADEEEMNVGG